MRRIGPVVSGAVVFSCFLGAVPGASAESAKSADDKSTVEEILGILKERGDIGDEEYQRLVTKNAKHESKKDEAWTDRITLSGDLRGRYEGFWYDGDPTGGTIPNRHRMRYRARLGATARINDYVSATVRLGSGENDSRSTNQTLGRGVDFAPDSIFIDQAYLRIATRKGQIPVEGGSLGITLGKVPNPFLTKSFRDVMLWDNDITPEGLAVQLSAQPLSELRLYGNAGYFVMDENFSLSGGTNDDPHFVGVQGGAELTPIEDLSLGSRVSWYSFHSIDQEFIQRGASGTGGATPAAGNIADGLTGDRNGGHFDVTELGAFATWRGLESWPVTLHGAFSRNWSAERSRLFRSLDPSDLAWSAGMEAGDKAKWLKLGVGFYHVESNAFPSQFIDSDILDGQTNREAWVIYATRQILANTDLTAWVSASDAIDEALPGTQAIRNALYDAPRLSVRSSDRVRAQLDLEVKF